jgi:hypothetical protein
MRVPWKPLEIFLGVIIAEIIHHQERIKQLRIAKPENTMQVDSGTFHCRLRVAGYFDRTNGHGIPFPKIAYVELLEMGMLAAQSTTLAAAI